MLRTSSKPGVLPVPDVVRDDVLNSYKNAINRAMTFIYIENQYLRDTRIADWIIERTQSRTQLIVIIVVPVAPEEVNAAGSSDPITDHGLALQKGILDRLAAALGSRFGVFSMVDKEAVIKRRDPSRPWLVGHKATDSPSPPFEYSSRQVYVHSKLMIVDDEFAIVGSANTNGRSFELDSEIGVAVYDPQTVSALRLELWGELLGGEAGMRAWQPSTFVSEWNKVATANVAARSSRERRGFVVSHDRTRFPGDSAFWLPDQFAGLTEQEDFAFG
jgi:phosphatidylserine/phosphatidylglycerophosphate/cardiolipin synthase-like enzyme